MLKQFGDRLRAARRAAGYEEAQEFAEAIGIFPGTYRRYERGETFPTLETLAEIRKHTGKSLDWLILGEIDHTVQRGAMHSARR